MTGSEILTSFDVYYDRITNFSAPGYEESEKLLFLNNAQDQFIKDRVFGKDFKPPAFEQNQKRVADLFPLVYHNQLTSGISASALYGNAFTFSKSALASGRVLYLLNLKAKVTKSAYPSMTTQWIECDEIEHDVVGNFISSDINKVHFINPKWLESAGNIYVIGDTYVTDMTAFLYTVIRTPYPITAAIGEYDGSYDANHMNLISSVHQEIVNMAVSQALQVIGDPRWQSKIAEEKINTD